MSKKPPAPAKADEPEDRCPSCGYCRHCGQSRPTAYPVYPTYPNAPTIRPWPYITWTNTTFS